MVHCSVKRLQSAAFGRSTYYHNTMDCRRLPKFALAVRSAGGETVTPPFLGLPLVLIALAASGSPLVAILVSLIAQLLYAFICALIQPCGLQEVAFRDGVRFLPFAVLILIGACPFRIVDGPFVGLPFPYGNLD